MLRQFFKTFAEVHLPKIAYAELRLPAFRQNSKEISPELYFLRMDKSELFAGEQSLQAFRI